MITPEYLENFRCPIDPRREARLELVETKVFCGRCRVQFRNREGFASLLTEEATLPEGCQRLEDLPCRARS